MGKEKSKVLDILDKFSFILGQRAGRELWLSKPEKVQNKDLDNFNRDIEYIRQYIENDNQPVWHKVADGDLPAKSGKYLVFDDLAAMGILEYCAEDLLGPYDKGYDFEKDDNMLNLKKGFNRIDHENFEYYLVTNVIAWMELPKV